MSTNTMIYISFGLVFLIVIVWKYFEERVKKPVPKVTNTETTATQNKSSVLRNFGLSLRTCLIVFGIYAAILMIVASGMPEVWKSWTDNTLFFIGTNVLVLLCAISIAIYPNWRDGFYISIFIVIAVIWWHYRQYEDYQKLFGPSPRTPVGNPPPPQTTRPVVDTFWVEKFTPDSLDLHGVILKLETSGEPILILPPGWNKENAAYYDGTSKKVFGNGNWHYGIYHFWSATPGKKVKIRMLIRPLP